MIRILIFFSLFISSLLHAKDEGKIVAVFHEKQELASASPVPIEDNSNSTADLPAQRYEASIFKVFLSFFGLIALAILSFWLFRRINRLRMTGGSSGKSIAILERRALSPKTMLYYLEVEGKKVLIAESHLEVKRLESWKEETKED